GRIGALKQSDRIALRVEPASGQAAPRLLRGPVYNFYSAGVWRAWDAGFAPAIARQDGAWDLAGRPADSAAATIALDLDHGAGVLPLPDGAARLSGLVGGLVSRNRLGAVRVEDGPGL